MRRRARRITVAVLILIGLLTAAVVAGLPVFVFPAAEEPENADLIYVIGPPRQARIDKERELRAEGVAEQSLYSVSTHGGWSAARLPVCREPAVFCEHPEPFTTKGEIAYLKRFAEEHDLHSTVVLTFTPHVARTRFILDKCYDGEATVVAVDQHLSLADWAYQYIYQTLALAKAWATPCSDAGDL